MNTPSLRIIALTIATLAAPAYAQNGAAFEKAASMRYPKIQFADTPLAEAAAFLSRASRDLTPDKSPINIVVRGHAEKGVSLKVENMPAADAIRYTAEGAGFNVTWSGEIAVFSAEKPASLPSVTFDKAGRGLFQRAAKVVLPKIDFQDATTREAVEFLNAKARELAPDGPRINIILNSPNPARPAPPVKPAATEEIQIAGLEPAPAQKPAQPEAEGELGERRLTVTLSNVSLTEAVRTIALAAGASVRWDTFAAVIGPIGSEQRPAVVNAVAVKGQVIQEKLSGIVMPKVEFRDATLRECTEFMSRKIKTLDAEGKGFNLLAGGALADERISIKLEQTPALEALRYMAELSGTELRIEHAALIFQQKN
jgi:hypothetical protein